MKTLRKKTWFNISLHTILPAALTLILFVLAIFFFTIPQYKKTISREQRQLIKDMTDMGYSLLEHYYQRTITGELTVEESQRRVIERIRSLRYGSQQKDYYWINNLEPKMIMHPYRMDLEGQNLSEYKDPEENFLFRELVDTMQRKNEGYVEYNWQWKDDPNRIVPKISYVRLFRPWGWIIGTGVYLEDVRGEVAAITRNLQMIFIGIFVIVSLISFYLIGHGIRVEMLRQKAEEERETLVKKLEEKNRQIQDFVYAVSHDLRAPLINIRGFSEELALSCKGRFVLSQDHCQTGTSDTIPAFPPEENIQEAVQFINSNVEKMESLINGLLELSRVGSRPMTVETVDMNEVLGKVMNVLQYQINSTHARIYVEALPPCLVDRNQINQVFCNLIDNALKYRHPERVPEIKITGIQKHREVEYAVADNGIGIEADKQEHIYDAFAQLKSDSITGGVGLGLTIVKRILELSNGRIWVESQPGRGTVFHLRLPSS